MINVILAEDHAIVRAGIKILLEQEKDINVVGEANNGLEVLALIEQGLEVDIILSDIQMPEMDGISLTREIKKNYAGIKVVILSMFENRSNIVESFSNGASGYLLKNVDFHELVYALKHVYNGGRHMSAKLTLAFFEELQHNVNLNIQNSNVDLTLRETEILLLIAEGLTNNEISEKLFLSKRTIEGHRQNLIEKTGCRNTASLIRFAVLNGIIQ